MATTTATGIRVITRSRRPRVGSWAVLAVRPDGTRLEEEGLTSEPEARALLADLRWRIGCLGQVAQLDDAGRWVLA